MSDETNRALEALDEMWAALPGRLHHQFGMVRAALEQRVPKEYGGWSINYYRGAIDAAFNEVDQVEQALGVQASRIRCRFEQLDRLVAGIEELLAAAPTPEEQDDER